MLELRRNRGEISDSTALWWGTGIIVFVVLVVFGILPVSILLKFGSQWLGK